MKGASVVRLGDVCRVSDRFSPAVAGKKYRQLGVRLWGGGLYHRDEIDGGDTKYKKFCQVFKGDLVVNKIWARNGAVGVAGNDHEGGYVSTEFPVFSLDSRLVEAGWMRYIVKWSGFWRYCDEKAQGTSGKNRVKPSQFLSIQIPLPSLDEQRAVVAKLDALERKTRQVEKCLGAIERDAERLLAQRFQEAIENAPLRPMRDVAPLVRREQAINIEDSYPELGIRSFGKGAFHKPSLSGGEVGGKRLYRIEPGDLLFSNVFAWEGAIAVARSEDSGRFGSHRFITCVADAKVTSANFLRYYFLSEEGLLKIREASPGGAGRNRTLGLEKLMNIEVPVPSLEAQRRFDILQSKILALKSKHAAIREANVALLPAMLERMFAVEEQSHG